MEVGAETFWRGFSSGRSSKWLATRAFWWFWFLQEMETSFRKKQTKCWCWDTRIMRGYSEMGIWDMDILWWISTYRRRQKLLTTFVSAIIRVQPASLLWPVSYNIRLGNLSLFQFFTNVFRAEWSFRLICQRRVFNHVFHDCILLKAHSTRKDTGSSRCFNNPLFRRTTVSTKVYRCSDYVEISGRSAISTTAISTNIHLFRNSGCQNNGL